MRHDLNDLLAFVTVARERSFTRAAAKLGVSQSALSHTIRRLEERIGPRLLTRTTRSVSPTQAGDRLLQTVGPRFTEIDAEVAALSELRDKPAGTIRVTAGEHAANVILWPAFARILPNYPDINVEITVDYDLTDNDCINLRLPTYGGLYAWEFEKNGRELNVHVEGQLVFNNIALRLNAALAGLGLAYLPEDQVQADIAAGRLVRVLADWCPPFAGYHLYYPSRRQSSPAFALLVDALRYRS